LLAGWNKPAPLVVCREMGNLSNFWR
jgi:hypothetical protein